MPSSNMDDNMSVHSRPDADDDDDHNGPDHPRKRQRVRLSCLECRRRKLSCDRGYPCQRCLKSGTPDRCTYETKSGVVMNASAGVPPAFAQLDSRRHGLGLGHGHGHSHGHSHGHAGPDMSVASSGASDACVRDAAATKDHDRIRRLELEVAQLKGQLTHHQNGSSFDGSTVAASNSPLTDKNACESPSDPDADQVHPACYGFTENEKAELRFFRGKEFRTRYFGPHNATMAFLELGGLCPFMQETADEWLRPAAAHDLKDRKKRKEDRERLFLERDLELEALVPPRAETDALVEVYLSQFEQVHRIVHIPTFRREYARFWENAADGSRYAALTAMLLAMIAISNCIHTHDRPRFTGMLSNAHNTAHKWIEVVERWQARQSMKHRRLIHYQIACLLYLGKRINTVKKKRFWTNSGALIQDGISVGLHRDPGHMGGRISLYNQEMRRRIWATVQEFDIQASFDHGLPTLLSQLHYDVSAPRNLDDEDFDEETTQLPPSKPAKDYTYSSYQNLARQSLPLRMELSRLLCGPPGDLDYEQVIRFTNDITREIDSLPSWETDGSNSQNGKRPLLAYTLLHIQLRQYIIPLHQRFIKLRKSNPKYQYSEIIYYNAARDIVLLHDKLYDQGVRCLNFLREDALTTAVNLCKVTMLQPRGSTHMIMINSAHTPWGYSIMCAALGLLERFVNLHYKLLSYQDPPMSSTSSASAAAAASANEAARLPGLEVPERAKSVTPFSFPGFPASQGSAAGLAEGPAAMSMTWMPSAVDPAAQAFNPDFSMETLGLNLNELWGESWDFS
ncbi:Transcription factor asR3 like protein [Verticillium longisporum]|uniref:Transcription factor asR3 like protein n=1 Tax=Verticillium longisporum TaxID=100787 RepID=A0A8I3AMT7_VERLO|nr:Transcription factor asR3 like protein [Verticillium longisporum]